MNNENVQDIIAINFGIFETHSGFKAYLSGSKTYDENNDDWACNEDFVPKQKYFSEDFIKITNWEECETKLIGLIKNYIQTDNYNNSILSNVKYITCGFDNGDLKIIKTTSQQRV